MLTEDAVESFSRQVCLCGELPKPSPGIGDVSEMQQEHFMCAFFEGSVQVCYRKLRVLEILEQGLFIISRGHCLL